MLFKKNLKFASFMAVTVFLTLGLSISFSSLLAAWTAPTAAPPAGNTAPLIYNESATPATSALINVPLGVSGNLTVNPGGIITGDGSSITSINASNLSAGTVPNARLNAHLQDLADGELSGGKVGAGINGDNITNGTIDSSEIEDNTLTASDLADNACGSAELEDSPVFVNPTASIPTVNNHVATKEYVDAASNPYIDWNNCSGNSSCIYTVGTTDTISCAVGHVLVSHSCAMNGNTVTCMLGLNSLTIKAPTAGNPAGVCGSIKCCKYIVP